MIILTIRTDKPEAELGVFEGSKQLAYNKWLAHRQLAETLHNKIAMILCSGGEYSLKELGGIVCFQGPGSFTGLRIGLTVANALAYSYGLPIVATGEPDWQETGIKRLLAGENDVQALPFYGADAHITPPKK